MKLLNRIAAVAAVAAGIAAAAPRAEAHYADTFFPLHVGNEWVYEHGGFAANGQTTKVTCDSSWTSSTTGNIYFRMGYYPGVIAFAAAVLGGIGNLKGALLGGMLLGFAKAFFATYSDMSEYDFAFCFSVMILVIIVRPYGLLGRASAVRA